jgi:4-amino-4-deoxy-L-arabinose transferase-like glycosyltransferase
VGLMAAVVCATTFFFFRQSQYATTDAQLALWVAVANAAMAVAVFRRRYWVALPVAGAALGMSLLAKGPVGLLQSLIPVVLFVIVRAVWSRRSKADIVETNGDELASDAEHGQRRTAAHATPFATPSATQTAAHRTSWKLPLLVGVLLMLAVGSSWYVAVAATHANVIDLWRSEISRVDADEVPAGAFYSHFVSLWQFFPWLAWLALGLVVAGRDAIARRASPALFAGMLLLVPVIVMSFAKDRFPRYLVPLMPAGSLLIALGLEVVWNGAAQSARHVRMLISAHWLMVGGWAIALPLIMAGKWVGSLRTPAGEALMGWLPAIALAALAAGVLAAGMMWQRRQPAAALVAVTFVLMLGAQALHAVARANSPAGDADLRPAAEQLRREYPNVKVYARGANKKNPINIHANTLSIYLNQTSHWTDSAEELANTPGPLVLVMTRGRNEPDPPTPPGWRVLLKTTGGDKKYVFLRP